jgi:hypothetical protein
MGEDGDGRGGMTPWRRRVHGRNWDETVELLQAGSTDYGYVDGS